MTLRRKFGEEYSLELANAAITELLTQSDQALTAAEEGMEELSASAVIPSTQRSTMLLLKAFIVLKGEEPAGDSLRELWNQCVALESEFLELEETIEYLLVESPLEDLDAEDVGEIIDAANEAWDFMIGFFPENVLPGV
jgi:HEPN domain-containing protein